MPLDELIGKDNLPYVGVMPWVNFKGVNAPDQPGPTLTVQDFKETFETEWPTDAHFITYLPYNAGEGTVQMFPRMNKPCLPAMRIQHGADIYAWGLVLDYDNPDHLPWTEESFNSFLVRMERAQEKLPMVGEATLFYTTRNGARFVYVYSVPIPVDDSEPRHRWVCQQFCDAGLTVDLVISDWTRIFRLPKVVRGKERTSDAEFAMFMPNWNMRLDPAQLEELHPQGPLSSYAAIREFTEPKPEIGLVEKLLSAKSKKGNLVQSEWLKEAKRRLKGRDCYGCIFNHVAISKPGYRDSTIHRYVGQAISMLYGFHETGPEHIYALFLDPVMQLQPDENTLDWTDVLWDAVGRLWAKEEAKAEHALVKEAEDAEKALELVDRVVNGMKEWCDAPELRGDKAAQWAARRLIVSCGNNYFVMRDDGRYDAMQLNSQQVIPRIRLLGMDKLIKTREVTDAGLRDIPLTSVLGEHATPVFGIRAVPNVSGGYVDNMDKEYSQFVMPSFCRDDDLIPEYSRDVDHWLKLLFGEMYDRGCEWIAWALAFEEGPICALSIAGTEGLGKKMLVQGLAECLKVPALADANDLVSDHQYGLLTSPFLVVNEGWPKGYMNRHPADQFRAFVSGDPMNINRKFMAPVKISNPVRVIFTANNLEVVRMLTGNRDMSPEDRQALAIRILHISCDDEARKWLRSKGGMRFTAAPGRRWITADGGDESDKVVAKHFMWLYMNRRQHKGNRFLVEGNNDETLMFEMRTSSGVTPLVLETILRMVESRVRLDGLTIDNENKLYVLTSEIMDYFRQHISASTRERLTTKMITGVLRSLVVSRCDYPFELKSRKKQGLRRWKELDCEALLAVAERDGWKCDKLRAIRHAQMEGEPYIGEGSKHVSDS